MQCVLKEAMGDCYLPYSVHVREVMRTIDFKVFLGSDWPVFALLNTLPWTWPGFDRDRMDFDCERWDVFNLPSANEHVGRGDEQETRLSRTHIISESRHQLLPPGSAREPESDRGLVNWSAFRDLFVWPGDWRHHYFESSIHSYHDPGAREALESEDAEHEAYERSIFARKLSGGVEPRPLEIAAHLCCNHEDVVASAGGSTTATATVTSSGGGETSMLDAVHSSDESQQIKTETYNCVAMSEEALAAWLKTSKRAERNIRVGVGVDDKRKSEKPDEVEQLAGESQATNPGGTGADEDHKLPNDNLSCNEVHPQYVFPPNHVSPTPDDEEHISEHSYVREIDPISEHAIFFSMGPEGMSTEAYKSAADAHYYARYRSWWLDSIKFVYSTDISANTPRASKECLYGLYTANVIKGLWAADTESSAFQAYAEHIQGMFYESLQFLAGSRWPIFSLLEHGKSLRRHGFNLDYTEAELQLPWRDSGPYLQSLSPEAHAAKVLSAFGLTIEDAKDPRARAYWRRKRRDVQKKCSATLPISPEQPASGPPNLVTHQASSSVIQRAACGGDEKKLQQREHVLLLDYILTEVTIEKRDHETTRSLLETRKQKARSKFFAGHRFSLKHEHYGWRPVFVEQVRQIVGIGMQNRRFAYMSFVYGKYRKYLRGWVKRLHFLGMQDAMLFLCLDRDTLLECEKQNAELGYPGRCAEGESISSLNKFTIVLLALQLGIDVFWLDLDLFLVQDPSDSVLALTRGGGDGDIDDKWDFSIKYADWKQRTDVGLYPLHGDALSALTEEGRRSGWYQSAWKELRQKNSGMEMLVHHNHKDAAAPSRDPPYEMLISYAFESDCICNGFFFLKSTPTMTRWLWELLVWLYQHPYEHDQRAMSAFLNYTEKVSFPAHNPNLGGERENGNGYAAPGDESQSGEQGQGAQEGKPKNHVSEVDHVWHPPPVPRWFVFEPHNHFVNWPGWTGSLDEIKLIHFLDGAAYSLYGRGDWDASIPENRRSIAEEISAAASSATASTKQDKGTVVRDDELPQKLPQVLVETQDASASVLDIFYQEEVEREEGSSSLTKLQKTMIMEQRRESVPLERQKCGILPNVDSAHKGIGWVDAEVRKRYPIFSSP
ncbi:unnamed protein product [Amoebophrya sp. A25]|nr:unnamed protein product [Amoebophrya sp. A25]|eukprot:GSA25T00010598001.1